jgi:S-adenosyl-L-methionine hydrolase (adenosine-forming)
VNTITLLSDFGLKDPYVGIMKGVMLSLNPHLTLIDITHDIEPQDVREACFVVPEYYDYFPLGTVHLCVVDPTVGSSRRALIVEKDGHIFVGPDNGLFSLILNGANVREITNNRFMMPQVSSTFHGRDIFSPVAAHVTLGASPSDLGPPVVDPVCLSDLHPAIQNDRMTGEIVRFDLFGNAISNISHEDLATFVGAGSYVIDMGGLSFRNLSRSYFENTYVALIGSSGYLEFGLFKGNLAADKQIKRGTRVTIQKVQVK